MEHDTDILFSSKMKDKTRRRSSIFSLLKRQKKLSRQVSEPGPLPRKFSVDSAILSDFRKMDGYKVFLESRRDVECNGNGGEWNMYLKKNNLIYLRHRITRERIEQFRWWFFCCLYYCQGKDIVKEKSWVKREVNLTAMLIFFGQNNVGNAVKMMDR